MARYYQVCLLFKVFFGISASRIAPWDDPALLVVLSDRNATAADHTCACEMAQDQITVQVLALENYGIRAMGKSRILRGG